MGDWESKSCTSACLADRVVVVEEECELEALLRDAGYTQIATARTPRLLEEVNRRWRPDIVVVGADRGLDDVLISLAKLRVSAGQSLPIVLVSNEADADFRLRALEAGVSEFVARPAHAKEVIARVGQQLALRRTVRELTAFQRQIENDLAAATRMQLSLLKSQAQIESIARPRGCRIETLYRPSAHLSGDLFDVIPINETRFAIYQCDFSGHGVAAAINAFRFHEMVIPAFQISPDAKSWMARINRDLHAILPREHFATCFAGGFCGERMQLEYSSAGSPPPILYRAASGQCELLADSSVPLGCEENSRFGQTVIDLSPGDILLVYSDALIENFNHPELSLTAELLGDLALGPVFRDRSPGAPERLAERILGDASRRPADDLTIMIVEFGGLEAP